MSDDDPGRIGWETAISGAWPLPQYESGGCNCANPDEPGTLCPEHGMREHLIDTDYCWCQPRIEDALPDGRVIIHRRTADGPE